MLTSYREDAFQEVQLLTYMSTMKEGLEYTDLAWAQYDSTSQTSSSQCGEKCCRVCKPIYCLLVCCICHSLGMSLSVFIAFLDDHMSEHSRVHAIVLFSCGSILL